MPRLLRARVTNGGAGIHYAPLIFQKYVLIGRRWQYKWGGWRCRIKESGRSRRSRLNSNRGLYRRQVDCSRETTKFVRGFIIGGHREFDNKDVIQNFFETRFSTGMSLITKNSVRKYVFLCTKEAVALSHREREREIPVSFRKLILRLSFKLYRLKKSHNW